MDTRIGSADLPKDTLRRRLIAARKAMTAPDRMAAAVANGSHLAAFLTGSSVVCGYLPLATEPLETQLLDLLVAAGTTVLIPVVSADAPLDWCRYPSPTTAGAFGIAEPTGPALGAAVVRSVDAILVPALAVDLAGHRLGRGGGHYDRTLALLTDGGRATVTAALIAVLFDGEILDEIPAEAHDIAVTAAVTPTGGIRYFRS